MYPRVTWPAGKTFAFTIFDDPDGQTLDNGRPVYDFLGERGFRTTKGVWPLPGKERSRHEGTTCDDAAYRRWVTELKHQGFELALHNVTHHTSVRSDTILGLERFAEIFGEYPRALANHTGCRESIYWGNARLTGARERLYNLLLRNKNRGTFQGHVEQSPLFWGDICRQRITYVRNFVFGEVNTLKACPCMPYHDPNRPFVNFWFAGAEGGEVRTFGATLSEANQDRLAFQGGACIVYAHLARGFSDRGRLHPGFRALMERLSRLGGWFVPVSTLLDHLRQTQGSREISDRERRRLETRWLWEKVWRGTS
jgi:hypothetical protein